MLELFSMLSDEDQKKVLEEMMRIIDEENERSNKIAGSEEVCT